MRRILGGIFAGIAALVLILFAVSNRGPIEIKFEPLPYSLELPLYAALLGILVLGFIAGGLVAFIAGGRTRKRARRAEAEAERLRLALATAQRQPPAPPVPAAPPPSFPKAG